MIINTSASKIFTPMINLLSSYSKISINTLASKIFISIHSNSSAELTSPLEKFNDLPTEILQKIANYLLYSDLKIFADIPQLGKHFANQSIRTRLGVRSVPQQNATKETVENNLRRKCFVTDKNLEKIYKDNINFQNSIKDIVSYTTPDDTQIETWLYSAQVKYKGDLIFDQFINQILAPPEERSNNYGYDYGNVLEILSRKELNIAPNDLIDTGLCTPEEMENIFKKGKLSGTIAKKWKFSETKQCFLNQNFLGFFIPARKISLEAFFNIHDCYIEQGVVNTYKEAEGFYEFAGVTPEMRGVAKIALQNIFASNMFQYAHLYKEGHLQPCYWAASTGNKEYVTALLNAGMPIDEVEGQKNGGGLHGAASNDEPFLLKDLLKRGANPLLKDAKNKFPLHIAAEKGIPEIIELLIEKITQEFADLNFYEVITSSVFNLEQSILEKLAYGHHSESFEYIIKKLTVEQRLKLLEEFKTLAGWSLLSIAARFLRSETIQLLLKNCSAEKRIKLLLSFEKINNWTPLFIAARNNRPEIIEELIKGFTAKQLFDLIKMDRDISKNKDNILHTLARNDESNFKIYYESIKCIFEKLYLSDLQFFINQKNSFNYTPIKLAKTYSLEGVPEFLEYYLNINVMAK